MKRPSMILITKDNCRVGTCVHTDGKGWRFIPAISNHKPSRKFWPSCCDCIPAWAFDISDEMLTAEELQKRTA